MDTESTQTSTDILGKKKQNYQFLMLVRDKKYPQALTLGKKILETEPNNPSVRKFCDFIVANNKELEKMVEQEKEDEQYESVDEDDDDGEDGEEEGEEDGEGEEKEGEEESEDEEQDDKQDEEEEQEEQEEEKQKPKPKVQLRTCTLNQIPHICTRDHGPKQQ